jgi:hypothetical protein
MLGVGFKVGGDLLECVTCRMSDGPLMGVLVEVPAVPYQTTYDRWRANIERHHEVSSDLVNGPSAAQAG